VNYREWICASGYLHKEWRNELFHRHREYGPAFTTQYPDGSIRCELFYLNSILHRKSGPAEIYYNLDGSIEWEDFFLNGKLLGENKGGFWRLWDKINEDERKNPTLLKYLAKYS